VIRRLAAQDQLPAGFHLEALESLGLAPMAVVPDAVAPAEPVGVAAAR
jgi:hypothetical protein